MYESHVAQCTEYMVKAFQLCELDVDNSAHCATCDSYIKFFWNRRKVLARYFMWLNFDPYSTRYPQSKKGMKADFFGLPLDQKPGMGYKLFSQLFYFASQVSHIFREWSTRSRTSGQRWMRSRKQGEKHQRPQFLKYHPQAQIWWNRWWVGWKL